MKARLNFSLKRVSVEPYRSKLTTNAADRVEVNSKLKLECSTLVTDLNRQKVRQVFSVIVNTDCAGGGGGFSSHTRISWEHF